LQPTNAKDNSQSGYTGNTIVDGIKLDGTRLWRIDLGRNIRSGAHYTQFQVYDYDGDGKAEVAMKTADGTKDGTGAVIGSFSADHRNSSGYVLSGPEYLTMFNGQTGKAMQSVDYVPARGAVSSWGDSYGNRGPVPGGHGQSGRFPTFVDHGSRLLHPRGDRGLGLAERAVHPPVDLRLQRQQRLRRPGQPPAAGGGRGRRRQERGRLRRDGRRRQRQRPVDDAERARGRDARGRTRPVPLEEFKVDEDSSKPSSWMAAARTGQILWSTPAGGDNGRGVSGDIWSGSAGAEAWSSLVNGVRNPKGAVVASREPGSSNFLAWWDGDTTRELLDGTHVDKYGTSGDTRLLHGLRSLGVLHCRWPAGARVDGLDGPGAGWMGGVAGGNAHRVGQVAFFQSVAESGGIPVTGVHDDQGNVDAPRPGLVDHVQGQLPLLHMPHPVGDAAAGAAGDLVRVRLRRGRIPGRGQEQPPVHRGRGMIPPGAVTPRPGIW
jgi:rhamnogalacturonan endolyase